MTMHATLDRAAETGSGPLFFAEWPGPARDQQLVEPPQPSTYGSRSAPNWPMVLAIVAFHAVALWAMIKLDVIAIAKPKPAPLVIDLIAEAAPPPVIERPAPQPAPDQKAVTPVVAPPPLVPTSAPPPPVTVANVPPPPRAAPVVTPPAGPVSVGNLDEKLLAGKPPRYPMESRRKHEEGTVVLRLLIGADGRVQQISVAQSSGFDRLDEAALQAVRTWRWQPTLRDGQPVEVRGLYTMPFALS